jgi:hypothetical protein
VDLEYVRAALKVGQAKLDLAIKAAGAEKGRVEGVRSGTWVWRGQIERGGVGIEREREKERERERIKDEITTHRFVAISTLMLPRASKPSSCMVRQDVTDIYCPILFIYILFKLMRI